MIPKHHLFGSYHTLHNGVKASNTHSNQNQREKKKLSPAESSGIMNTHIIGKNNFPPNFIPCLDRNTEISEQNKKNCFVLRSARFDEQLSLG